MFHSRLNEVSKSYFCRQRSYCSRETQTPDCLLDFIRPSTRTPWTWSKSPTARSKQAVSRRTSVAVYLTRTRQYEKEMNVLLLFVFLLHVAAWTITVSKFNQQKYNFLEVRPLKVVFYFCVFPAIVDPKARFHWTPHSSIDSTSVDTDNEQYEPRYTLSTFHSERPSLFPK